MDIPTYLADRHGAQTELARKLKLPPQLIWQWARGVRAVPVERCPSIEQATDGAVRCEDIRPDIDWKRTVDGIFWARREAIATEGSPTPHTEPAKAA